MSVLISWEQLLTSQRLPSGDVIKLTVSPDYIQGNLVAFTLTTAPRVTWQKRIRFFGAQGETFLRTQDSIHTAGPASYSINSFDTGGLRIELQKAMFGGMLTGVYELNNVKRWKGRTLHFEWLED